MALMKLIISFILTSFFYVQAETKNLKLVGTVTSQATTTMKEKRMGTDHVQWAIFHSSNARDREAEKIEVLGTDQPGLSSKIDLASNQGKFIQHQILLDLVSYTNVEKKPVILKISAN